MDSMKLGNKTFTVTETEKAKVLKTEFRTVKAIQDFFNQYNWLLPSRSVVKILPITEETEILGFSFISSVKGFTCSIEVEA